MLKLRFKVQFKVILLVMLAAGIMSSCSRHHKESLYDEIRIGTATVGTKALVTDKASLIDLSVTNNTGFGVYGYKTIPNKTPYRQFNNTLVHPDENSVSTSWSYTPKRYWDSSTDATYQFVAYWPLLPDAEPNGGGTYVSEAGKVFTIHNIPNWQPTSTGTDFLVDAQSGKYKSNNSQPKFAGGTVSFKFEHILSRVQVRAYYVGAKAEIAVNQITLESPTENTQVVLKDDGKTELTRYFNENGTTNQYGTIQSGASKQLMSSTYTLSDETWFEDLPNTTPEKYDTLCSWLTVPCSLWDGLKISVDYSIAGSNLSGSASGLTLRTPVVDQFNQPVLDQNNKPDTLNGQTRAGYSYMITLKFTASSGIDIESIKVQDWADGGVFSPEVYNW